MSDEFGGPPTSFGMTKLAKSQKSSDIELVRLAAQGCRDSIARLVFRHQREIRLYLAKRTGSIEVGDELAQEVFLTLVESLNQISDGKNLRGWLFAIARNKTADYFRHKKKELPTENSEIERILIDVCISQHQQPEPAPSSDVTQVLKDCIEKLKPHSKNLVRARYFDDRSAEEISKLTGKKSSNIRMTLLRIRKALARCVRKQMGGKIQ